VIRERNEGGLAFFLAEGFRAAGVLRQPFDDSPDDGYVLYYRHVAATWPANRIRRFFPCPGDGGPGD
jgi:hypothetical protein